METVANQKSEIKESADEQIRFKMRQPTNSHFTFHMVQIDLFQSA